MPPNTSDSVETLFKECSFGFELHELIEFYASLGYGSLSIVLYIIEIAIILRSPKLKQPFYFQFIYLAVMNISLWLIIFFMGRIIPHPFFCRFFYPAFKTPSSIWKPLIVIYGMSIPGQLGTVMLININRMCVILWPLKADKFWNRYDHFGLIAVFLWSVAWSSTLWMWTAKVDWITFDHLTMQFVEDWPRVNPNLLLSILSVVCLLVILLTTVVSLVTLWGQKASTRVAEVNLFWTNVAFSITTGVMLVLWPTMYVIYWIAYNEQIVSIFMDYRGFIYDINCLTPAWLLLLINRPIRMNILKMKSQVASTINIGSSA